MSEARPDSLTIAERTVGMALDAGATAAEAVVIHDLMRDGAWGR